MKATEKYIAFRYLLIILLGAFITLGAYHLDQVPPGFFCDEASSGISASLIWQSGRDEYGRFLPAYFQSLGYYVDPVYIYSLAPVVGLFGLSVESVRFTSVLWGALCILGTYLFVAEIFADRLRGFLAAYFLALSPWLVFSSRIGFQGITFPALFVLALYATVKAMREHRLLPLCGVLWGIALYAYGPARIICPAAVALLTLIYRTELRRAKWWTASATLVLLLIWAPAVYFLVSGDILGRWDSVSIVAERGGWRAAFPDILTFYFNHFSYRFLFAAGDGYLRNSVHGFGLYSPSLLVLIVVGILGILFTRNRASALLMFWLLCAFPLAGSITRDGPSNVRDIVGVPIFPIIAACGAAYIVAALTQVKFGPSLKSFCRILILVAIMWLPGSHLVRYLSALFGEYPKYAAIPGEGWQFGAKQALDYFAAVESDFDEFMITDDGFNAAHILPRFFYPSQDAAAKFKICNLSCFKAGMRQVWALRPGAFDPTSMTVLNDIRAPSGEVALRIVTVPNVSSPINSWRVLGAFAKERINPGLIQAVQQSLATNFSDITGDAGTHKWINYNHGSLPFLPPKEFAGDSRCAFAAAEFSASITQGGQLRVGFDDTLGVWLNGREVFRPEVPSASQLDAFRVPVSFGKLNSLLILSCNDLGDWYFHLRFTDSSGREVAISQS